MTRRRKDTPPARPATSYDVARLAGVSQSAVSRVFNPGSYTSDAMRERVLRAAAALGFTPNGFARGLRSDRSGIVSIVMTTLDNPNYPGVIEAFARAFQRQGRQVALIAAFADAEDALARIVRYRSEGVVLTAATRLDLSRRIAGLCVRRGLPLVLYNRRFRGIAASSVTAENEAGGAMAAQHLLACGRRRAGIIAGSEPTSTVRHRIGGFVSAMRAAGAPAPPVARAAQSYDGGAEAGAALLGAHPRLDALFCAADVMALGTIDHLRHRLGRRVPDDVAVVGFDDIPSAAWATFDLTTIHTDHAAMVEQAAQSLADAIDDPGRPAGHAAVAVRLVARGSTPPPRPRPA